MPLALALARFVTPEKRRPALTLQAVCTIQFCEGPIKRAQR